MFIREFYIVNKPRNDIRLLLFLFSSIFMNQRLNSYPSLDYVHQQNNFRHTIVINQYENDKPIDTFNIAKLQLMHQFLFMIDLCTLSCTRTLK